MLAPIPKTLQPPSIDLTQMNTTKIVDSYRASTLNRNLTPKRAWTMTTVTAMNTITIILDHAPQIASMSKNFQLLDSKPIIIHMSITIMALAKS